MIIISRGVFDLKGVQERVQSLMCDLSSYQSQLGKCETFSTHTEDRQMELKRRKTSGEDAVETFEGESFVQSIAQTKSNFKEALDFLFATLEHENERQVKRKSRYHRICNNLQHFAKSQSEGQGQSEGRRQSVVKLNIGGRHVDLKSKSLHGQLLSLNMFSSILSTGRWAPYLLTDHQGRCFFGETSFDFVHSPFLPATLLPNFHRL